MARDATIQIRDQEIIADLRDGMTGREVAKKYGLTPGRISQIAKGSLDTEGPVEELRDWLVQGYLGDLRILGDIAHGPGRPITSGKGDHVIDAVTGLPAYDPSPRIDAIAKAGQVRKNTAMLVGAEKPVAKAVEETVGLAEALEFLRETAKENESLKDQILTLRAKLGAMEAAQLPEAEVVELPLQLDLPAGIERDLLVILVADVDGFTGQLVE